MVHWLGHYFPCEKRREDSLATDALGQFFQPFLVERPARVGRGCNQILMTEEADGLGAGFSREGHVVKAQKDFRTVVRIFVGFQCKRGGWRAQVGCRHDGEVRRIISAGLAHRK